MLMDASGRRLGRGIHGGRVHGARLLADGSFHGDAVQLQSD
jgi:hypothetical protein